MRRRLAPLCAVVTGLLAAPVATADHWPMAGGTPSRSSNASLAPGDIPVAPAWQAFDGRVRTPMVVTGGGGPDVQRVAYGTDDGRVHVRVLATGAPVGPPEGIDIDGSTLNQDGDVFGSDGAVGFADTSTEDRLGQLLVVHTDDSAGVARVFLARISLETGQPLGEDTLVASGPTSCEIESSPLLTPASASGGRVLYFVILCSGGLARHLVRLPIQGDATSPSATVGAPGFAYIPDASLVGSPAAVVLRDAGGAPVFHIAVPRAGRLDIFRGDDPLDAAVSSTERTPAITAPLQAADEIPRTPAAPSTDAGLVAGMQGSGTGGASSIFVAAAASGTTKVYRLVQDGAAQTLRIDRAQSLGDGSGAPGPGLAVAETMTPTGPSPGGLLVVTHGSNLTLLSSSDLGIVRKLSGTALAEGYGFARTVPAVSGAFAYVSRDGSATVTPEQLVLRLDGLTPLAGGDFQRVEDRGPQDAAPRTAQVTGQPAISHGHVLFGGASGAFAYRSRDAGLPSVSIVAPPEGDVSGTVTLVARAVDVSGIDSVTFRLSSDGGGTRTLGRVTQADGGSAFADGTYSLPFPTGIVPNGAYQLDAVATDKGGNTAASEKRRVRILNPVDVDGLPAGACVNPLTGSGAADRITGSSVGDRILGGGGDDRLDGADGHDCVLGEDGADVLSGGKGDDLLEGGAGEDVLAGGAGRNRFEGGAGPDVARGGSGAERFAGGAGNDTMLAGKGADRLDGGAGHDTLKGESGDDRISGGAGNDTLSGGSGANRIDGGAGNDRISAYNRRRDVITCGKGRDRVTADRRDRVSRSCERVSRRGRR